MSAERVRGIALTANALDPDLIVLLGEPGVPARLGVPPEIVEVTVG